jgi:dTDP-glucose 4,6-dehydratase
MNILVTGGAGFIGTRLCEKLLELGHAVVCCDKLTYAANRERAEELHRTNPVYTLEVCDTRNDLALLHLLRTNNCDAVMHLAAESHVDRSISGPQTFLDANVLGTYGVLEAVRAYLPDAPPGFRLLHVSTDEVFGDLPLNSDAVFDEHSRYNPSSPYSASKAAADHLVRAWGRTYGVPYVITYGANAYGPGQLPDKLVPMCIVNGLRGLPITINGTGENVRSWLHVDDHVSGLIATLKHGRLGEAYCLSSGEELSNLDMAYRICHVLDELMPLVYAGVVSVEGACKALIKLVEDRPGNDLRYAMTSTKARRELSWVPRMWLREALADTILWYIAKEQQ